MRYHKILRQLLRDQAGATAVEYGLIVSLIVVATVAAMREVADENTGLWAVVSANVTSVMGGSSGG